MSATVAFCCYTWKYYIKEITVMTVSSDILPLDGNVCTLMTEPYIESRMALINDCIIAWPPQRIHTWMKKKKIYIYIGKSFFYIYIHSLKHSTQINNRTVHGSV